MRARALLITPLFLLVLAAAARSQTSELVPGNEGGLFVVEDAVKQFEALKHHGEAIGWWNDESRGAIDPSNSNHYQGVVRYPGVGVPVFYVTQKAKPGYLHVARLGTRSHDGERLRSNLQYVGADTASTTPPLLPADPKDDAWVLTDTWVMKRKHPNDPSSDFGVNPIRFDKSLQSPNGITLYYEHPGGMAIVDDILFVSLDTPLETSPVCATCPPPGAIALFDLHDDPNDPNDGPERPTLINALPLTHKIDNLAVTTWGDDAYLIWVNGDGGTVTKFYTTNTSVLRNDALEIDELQPWSGSTDHDPPIVAGCGPFWSTDTLLMCMVSIPFAWKTCTHQSSTFLRDISGSLYMIGMRHGYFDPFSGCGSPDVGPDYADLYQVRSENGRLKLKYLLQRHLYCVYDGGGQMRICNFGAGSTAYVSPSGELILYSVPHDDQDGFSPDIVRMGEFRHMDVTRENSPLRVSAAHAGGPYAVEEGGAVLLEGTGQPSADRPWVELYDDHDGWDFSHCETSLPPCDRSIVFDFDYFRDLEFWNFDTGGPNDAGLDDFNDKTTSIRWRTPVGLNVRVFDDNGFKDRNLVLGGRGRTQWIANVGAEDSTVTADADDVDACVADATWPVCVGMRSKQQNPYAIGTQLVFNDKTSSMHFEWDLSENQVPTEIVVRYKHPDFSEDPDAQIAAIEDVEERRNLVFLNEQASPDPTLLVRRYQNPAGDAAGASLLLNDLTVWEPAVRSAEPGSLLGLTWDLDGDGFFGETGDAAARGDEIGGSPNFLATELDGPSQVVVTLHATDSGTPGADTAVVEVTNVAPTTTIESITDETGAEIVVDAPFALVGLRIDMTGSFTDPGVLDTHTAAVDWGDGTLDQRGDVVETVNASHAYLAAWDYTVTLSVEDDDGGIGTATSQIRVVDGSGGLAWVVEQLRPLAADLDVRRAIAELEGQAGGRAANGAIDLLGRGNLNAAMVKVKHAMQSLEAVDPSLGLERIESLLALSAKSVAVDAVMQAEAAANRRSALRKVQQAWGLIQEGDGLLAALDLVGALERYERAVREIDVGLLLGSRR